MALVAANVSTMAQGSVLPTDLMNAFFSPRRDLLFALDTDADADQVAPTLSPQADSDAGGVEI